MTPTEMEELAKERINRALIGERSIGKINPKTGERGYKSGEDPLPGFYPAAINDCPHMEPLFPPHCSTAAAGVSSLQKIADILAVFGEVIAPTDIVRRRLDHFDHEILVDLDLEKSLDHLLDHDRLRVS
jgi:hypothetical protein